MNKIKLLDESTIQKIAAGEVIENPASIVKELVENSIDAGSTSVTVEISKGGKESIRVTDNGSGMTKDDLMIAFKRHSTSKLRTIDDVYNILSLGFRGEALASIASVSKVNVMSKTIDSKAGTKVSLEDGEILNIETIGTPKGTTMIIKDLFYNLPVRKKFLKTDLSESNNITNIITSLALGNPNVGFKYIKDSNIILQTLENDSLKNTIYMVLGKDFVKNSIKVDYRGEYIKINGYITNNNYYRGNRAHQFIYINGRYISNMAITKAIENRYKTLIPINRYPCFILNIEIDPSEVDVNIHPTKQEVKFTNHDMVIGSISNVINDYILKSLEIPSLELGKRKEKTDKPQIFEIGANDVESYEESISEVENIELPSKKEVKVEEISFRDYSNNNKSSKDRFEVFEAYDPSTNNADSNKETNIITLKDIDISKGFVVDENGTDSELSTVNESLDESKKIDETLLDLNIIGILFNTYVICENSLDRILYIIDQHAAHERVMYEKFKDEYKNENINTQQLLAPEIIELSHIEMETYRKNKEIFDNLGFITDEFGDNSIAIRGVPIIFGNPESKKMFIDIFENLEDIESNYDVKIDKIMKISCVNAVKGGDKLKLEEIRALIDSLVKCEKPYTCPHGRPTMIKMTEKELEKEFLRII